MTLPFALPDWLPAWAFLVIGLPLLLFALAFLLMPFSVFGVKARLEAIETQLDALHDEIRGISSRNFGTASRMVADEQDFDPMPHFGRLKTSQKTYAETPPVPPIPPPPLTPMVTPPEKPLPAPRLPQRPQRRTEPRLD